MFKGKVFLLVLIVVFLVVSLPGQSIVVTRPSSGNHPCCINESMRISWDKAGQMNERVKIRLFDRAGARILSITDNTPNSGTFTWNRIPSSIVHGFYVVRVKTIDDRVQDDSSAFIIMNCEESKPEEERIDNKIKITNPKHGDSWRLNTSHIVRWDNSGAGKVKIELGGRSGKGIVTVGVIYSGLNNGSWRWNISNYLDGSRILPGTYKLMITSLSDPENRCGLRITILPKHRSSEFITD